MMWILTSRECLEVKPCSLSLEEIIDCTKSHRAQYTHIESKLYTGKNFVRLHGEIWCLLFVSGTASVIVSQCEDLALTSKKNYDYIYSLEIT
jgi:hypothetical protein